MRRPKNTDLPYYRYTEIFDEPGEISCESSHSMSWSWWFGCESRVSAGCGHVTGSILSFSALHLQR